MPRVHHQFDVQYQQLKELKAAQEAAEKAALFQQVTLAFACLHCAAYQLTSRSVAQQDSTMK
jgi:hypothetical protein